MLWTLIEYQWYQYGERGTTAQDSSSLYPNFCGGTITRRGLCVQIDRNKAKKRTDGSDAARDDNFQPLAFLVINGLDSQRLVFLTMAMARRQQAVRQAARRIGVDRIDLDDTGNLDIALTPH